MIFELKQKNNKWLESVYEKSMKELNEFYGINWVRNTPGIFIVRTRKEINVLKGLNLDDRSMDWVTWWTSRDGKVYVLEYSKIKSESSHLEDYSKKEYEFLIKHELSHLFFSVLVKSQYQCVWLWEGVAIYTSGQNDFKKRPEKIKYMLNFYDKHKKDYGDKKVSVYFESGFFIGMLVEKFGKEKLLKFLKSLSKVNNRKEFDHLFFKTYKFKLNYKEINKIYQN